MLDEYTTDPVHIPHADTVELSYDKRESILRQDKLKLLDEVAKSFIAAWLPTDAECTLKTTGRAVDAHTPSATGKRKAFTADDVLAAMTAFNAADIPQEGRYLLLDAQMYRSCSRASPRQRAWPFWRVPTRYGVVANSTVLT